MNLNEMLVKWGLTGLSFKTPFVEADWAPKDADRQAAWDIYVELVTRVATQELGADQGTDDGALDSVYRLFPLTRETLKSYGPDCAKLARIAIAMLNQRVRPFTTKWHPRVISGSLPETEHEQFRSELGDLRSDLRRYTHLLADLAGVEESDDLSVE